VPVPSQTLAANWIDAGNPFRPTYAPGTVLIHDFQWDFIWNYSLKLYVADGWPSILLGTFAASTIIAIVIWRCLPLWLPVTLLVNFALSAAFYLTHFPHVSYYFVPVSTWGLYTFIFAGLGRAGEEAKGAGPALLSATALGGSLFMLAHLNFAKTSLLDKPQMDFSPEPNAVFWTANPSGYLVYLDIAYGATVMVADASTRQALLKAFGAEGLPQYFVADTPEINAIIVERQRMKKVGHLFGFNVYRENQS
jgi:hypothetical protein